MCVCVQAEEIIKGLQELAKGLKRLRKKGERVVGDAIQLSGEGEYHLLKACQAFHGVDPTALTYGDSDDAITRSG